MTPAPWLIATFALTFMFAVGACVGSFLNVVAHRLPLGQGLFAPGSRCPRCETPLRWTENFPVFGWLWLRGRCRFCRSPISGEYPLIEVATGLLFAGLYGAWFVHEATGVWGGSDAAPGWTHAGLLATWPMFTIVLTMIGSLIAMTLIDARTFTIPLILPWVATAVAVVFQPLHGAWIGARHAGLPGVRDQPWTIPVPDALGLGLALGALLGVGASLLLVRAGLMRRSFWDYEVWEESARESLSRTGTLARVDTEIEPSVGGALLRALVLTGPAIALMGVGFTFGVRWGSPFVGMAVGTLLGLTIGGVLRAVLVSRIEKSTRAERSAATPAPVPAVPEPGPSKPVSRVVRVALCVAPVVIFGAAGWALDPFHTLTGAGMGLLAGVLALGALAGRGGDDAGEEPTLWLAYPHARREMGREALFLAPAAVLAVLGAVALPAVFAAELPLWLAALGGALVGYVVGGGVVWMIRIVGTLALGKEAMGMGDVHLMAAVGACLGWIDPLLAFFTAPLFGLSWALLSALASGSRVGALPFGPHLALATIAVVTARPWYDALLARLMHAPGV
ncbi:MAG: hypothetical protein EA379_11480 [Phycisphaerales bacterium]|nr:MAG: hypothetical protein EA379_11480 [Phycisphaerales bacterium]